jgi:xanthine dehydrogenase accessory factor
MRDVLDPLTELWSAGGPVALATVVGTYSSAPRQAGASMLVAADGRVVGSVSGGCVEGRSTSSAVRCWWTASPCCSATASPTTTPSPSA